MSTIEITSLNAKYREKIIEIITDGFENYPLMQYFFGDSHKQSVRHLSQFICDEEPEDDKFQLIGAFVEGDLQGIAYISLPQNEDNNHDVETTPTPSEQRFVELIGEKAFTRVEKYINLKKANKISSPHFYINTFAVNPQNQGKGIGSAILSHIHQMSEQHPDSQGVVLDTQTEINVGYYQRFGYSISNTVELENVNNWFMFQPNKR
ncbi:GCN5-related N-acetyltransferase [Calothrix parasitica NIES-267]|uniref:GCN5-related N-acetyltransferase n=1 Tax=Calothrix parasitica NIES-267 TaxID=1973488 RepID=A0A1Z4LLN6_9CYAN|nr:GCN5-related N-acetyltransferase [Calothrix parasitica NIES-267]